MIQSINPATGKTLAAYEPHSGSEVERRLKLSAGAFAAHRRTAFADRAAKLARAAQILEHEKRRLGEMMTAEMGKTLVSAEAEAAKCATACRYYAEHGALALADEIVATSASRSYIRYEPLGPVLAVMPWNFPFWQVFRFAAPALMAGNTGLLKHASNVPQCALAIEDIFRRAGFAEGVFQTLLVESNRVEALIRDPRVRAVTLTGSEPAGQSVASIAGHEIKRTVLELGGSDPFIVMPSADRGEAIGTAVKARMINNGQSCIAAKRFIFEDSIYDDCARDFVTQVRALKVGDPMDKSTDIGPLATESLARQLHEQVEKAVAAGATILCGGKRGQGCFYEPTVLAGVPRSAAIYREEFFGPVAMLFRARGVDEAVAIANDTPFGLASSVWTRDESEQSRFIDAIEAGQVFVNAMVASDTRIPFGGVKRSGYGRELGTAGIREFVNAKTVWVK